MKSPRMSLEQATSFIELAAGAKLSGGSFREVAQLPDGTDIEYKFAFATGLAWNATKAKYIRRFNSLPVWVLSLHPAHRTRLCGLSMDSGIPLPDEGPRDVLEVYFRRQAGSNAAATQIQIGNVDETVKGEAAMSQAIWPERITEFEVSSEGTLTVAGFTEPETRAQFYESVADSWSGSPSDLVSAMVDCPPLAWAVHSIYTETREELQIDLDAAGEGDDVSQERVAALQARLDAMPEEPEEGARAWLLALTTSEFEARVVPEIEKWFSAPPSWNWEDDYLPRDSSAQGAALVFFEQMDEDDLDALGVVIVEGEHPGSSYYAAELTVDVEAANKAAALAAIPVRFIKGEE